MENPTNQKLVEIFISFDERINYFNSLKKLIETEKFKYYNSKLQILYLKCFRRNVIQGSNHISSRDVWKFLDILSNTKLVDKGEFSIYGNGNNKITFKLSKEGISKYFNKLYSAEIKKFEEKVRSLSEDYLIKNYEYVEHLLEIFINIERKYYSEGGAISSQFMDILKKLKYKDCLDQTTNVVVSFCKAFNETRLNVLENQLQDIKDVRWIDDIQ